MLGQAVGLRRHPVRTVAVFQGRDAAGDQAGMGVGGVSRGTGGFNGAPVEQAPIVGVTRRLEGAHGGAESIGDEDLGADAGIVQVNLGQRLERFGIEQRGGRPEGQRGADAAAGKLGPDRPIKQNRARTRQQRTESCLRHSQATEHNLSTADSQSENRESSARPAPRTPGQPLACPKTVPTTSRLQHS